MSLFLKSFRKTRTALAIAISIMFAMAAPHLATAEEGADQRKLSIELNATQQDGQRCRLVFLASNKTGSDIEDLSLETVLFNAEGVFQRLTLFDFKDLPEGRPRVRQFAVPETTCTDLGRILINGISTCKIEGAEAKLCDQSLTLITKTAIELVG